MKKILLLILCSFISTSQADIRDAQENYTQGNFKQAFDEFLVLAKFGNMKSQHNVAVMYANGQGVKQDIAQAYAWSKISDSFENYKTLTQAIKSKLTPEQLSQAETLSKEYFNEYADINSKVLLGPISPKEAAKHTAPKFKITYREVPKYPRLMALEGKQGLVDVLFNIYPNGSIRDIHITNAIPNEELFIKAAIKSIEYYSATPVIPYEEPIPATTRIEFKLYGSSNELSAKQQEFLDNLIKKANEGDLDAQYSYAILFETLLKKKGKISGKQVNQWLFNLAQNGVSEAQYRLGRNIYFGNACKVEKQKGLDWIMHAAQIGNPDAEYMAYQMLQNKKVINQSNQPPIYWLKQAAENGSNIAQLRYAGAITELTNPTKEVLVTAQKYLDSYQKKLYKTIQWYQINALVQNKLNKHSQALKSIKSAIKSAKKAGWDLTELERQKTMIEAQKT